MRFDLATISLAGAWAFSIQAAPVYTAIGSEQHELVDTASIQPALVADEVQAMAVKEFLSTAPFTGIDEPIEWKDGTVDLSHDSDHIHLGRDQDRSTASIVSEVDLPSSYTNYYYYLVLIPLGFVGFTIFKGWQTWQRERALELYESRHARGKPRTRMPLPS